MNIYIENKRRKRENILKSHPGAVIIDVTSKAEDKFKQLSPFYPVGNIAVPGMEDLKALCVEGIWQGLKVFENFDYDITYFNKSLKDIKRTVRKFGRVKGHYYKGELLGYLEARKKIYLPAYRYVLEKRLGELVEELRELAKTKDLILLDYTTNSLISDLSKPLSHAAVVKAAILNDYGILEEKPNKDKLVQGKLF
ncbi:MAG: hypothetical protein GXO89_17370 [Chlorobi bacterium]|nr:hypothetical protein [Chlorobiota bacterium]